MPCPRCAGLLRREPATWTCALCGRWTPVSDATEAERRLQLVVDLERRPRSVECLSPFNTPEYLGPRRLTAAAVRPGPRLPAP